MRVAVHLVVIKHRGHQAKRLVTVAAAGRVQRYLELLRPRNQGPALGGHRRGSGPGGPDLGARATGGRTERRRPRERVRRAEDQGAAGPKRLLEEGDRAYDNRRFEVNEDVPAQDEVERSLPRGRDGVAGQVVAAKADAAPQLAADEVAAVR